MKGEQVFSEPGPKTPALKGEPRSLAARLTEGPLSASFQILSPLAALLVWEAGVAAGLMDRRFFPAPSTIFVALGQLLGTGELLDHLIISLSRMAAGFLLGSIPGILLGLLMGWFRLLRALLDPLVAATFPVPKIAILPLVMLIFGIGELSKVVIIAIGCFYLVLISSMAGVRNIDPVLIEAARNFGARGRRMFWKVVLPSTLPAIFTGLRLSLGVSLIVIVAAEFVAANRGIGYLIWISWQTLTTEHMYVGILVIGILGILFTYGLERLGKAVMPWSVDFRTFRE
ncbi:MAG: ABC transporter permease [Deltaproteobacteria bacterium]|nr:ABC transporter permease [Deltaproteobacteria bacterium]